MPCLTQRLPSPPKVALELRSDGLLLAQDRPRGNREPAQTTIF